MKVKVYLSIIGLFLIIGCVADQTKYLPLKERSDYDLCVSYFTDYFSLLTQKEKYRKYKQIVGEIEKRNLNCKNFSDLKNKQDFMLYRVKSYEKFGAWQEGDYSEEMRRGN